MAEATSTFRHLVAHFTDFLTVAIHTILYERGIYPQTSFLTARKYNFAVRQNRHPRVCDWINDAVAAVETELLKGTVDRVVVVMCSRHAEPLERFVFDVARFPVVGISDLDSPLERIGKDGEKIAILPVTDFEEQCRATMSRLSTCGSSLRTLPKDCTFTVAIELKVQGSAPVVHPQPWIPVQPALNNDTEGPALRNTTLPLRTVAAGELIFEAWVEETKDDGDR